MKALKRENAMIDKWLVTNADRRNWFEELVQQPMSRGNAVAWLESLNLHDTKYVFRLAQAEEEAGNLLRAIEMLRYFACANLQNGSFANATVAVEQLHIWFVNAAISPRDFFLDDYLNRYLPKFCTANNTEGRLPKQNNQTSIGYLVPFSLDPKSTIPPIPGELAVQHSDDFSVALLVPYPRNVVEQANPGLVTYLESLHPRNSIIYHSEHHEDQWARVHSFAETIHSLNLDGLITMLSLYADSLISYMRPAPKIYAIDAGHPHWYSHRFMDRVFSGHPHFQLECQTESIYVPLGFTARSREKSTKASTHTLEPIKFVSESDTTLFSSGSDDKFFSDDFWAIVNNILRQTGVNWLFLGPDPEFVLSRIDRTLHTRIQAFGRSKNFDHFLSHADIYVDTIPVGGGYSILEAFQKGIACALYSHNFTEPFNKRKNYAPYSHISEDPSFAADSDKDSYQNHILELIGSTERRQKQIALQHEAAPKVLNSDRMIAAIEDSFRSEVA